MDLVADLADTVGRRFATVAILATLAAVAERAGLLLLMPLLDLLGIIGDQGSAMPMLREVGQLIGLGGALVFYVLLIATASGVIWARAVAGTALQLDYVDSLRMRLHAAVMATNWLTLAAQRQADITHTLTAEASQCGHAVQKLLQALASLAQLPALLGAAFLLSPGFTAAALVLAGTLAVAVRPLNRRAYTLGRALTEANQALHAESADQVAGLRILKMLRAEEHGGAAFRNLTSQVRERQLEQARASATARAAQRIAAAAAAALVIWAGLGPLALPLPDLLVLLALFARLMPAALSVQESWRIVLQLLPVHERLQGALAAWRRESEPAPAGPPPRSSAPSPWTAFGTGIRRVRVPGPRWPTFARRSRRRPSPR